MRTHYCGLVDEALIDQPVILCGWVDSRRDHGGVVFLDLRDHEGVVQIVADPDNADAFETASAAGYEFCLRVAGRVRRRVTANDRVRTGRVEVLADRIEVLNAARDLPFVLHETTNEDLRLKYRYLDLRRPDMQRALRLRTRLVSALRRHLDARGFQDIETPILTKATPEGARDYLVPSRVHPGGFYALPQSPQLFKQLLMVAGFDRYYQIARCFRDEDLRADRQPEFTQLDMEFAFVEERDVQDAVEDLIRAVFREVAAHRARCEFPAHDLRGGDAPLWFGQARPAHRARTGRCRRDGARRGVQGVLRRRATTPLVASPRCACRGGAELTRKQIDELGVHAAKYGAKGLAWIRVDDRGKGREGLNSPIAKFLDDATLTALLDRVEARRRRSGPVRRRRVPHRFRLHGCAAPQDRHAIAASSRTRGSRSGSSISRCSSTTSRTLATWLCIIRSPRPRSTTSPTCARTRGSRCRAATTWSSTATKSAAARSASIARKCRARCSNCSASAPKRRSAKFGFLLEALKFGAPPHGGIAFGIDRIAALMAGTDSIRDVIAFPKTTSAQDLMTAAPSTVPPAQLAELHVRVVERKHEPSA